MFRHRSLKAHCERLASTIAGLGGRILAYPIGAKVVPDGARINTANVIGVEMEDLLEKDRNDLELELQREIEEVMAEKRKRKLSCFQKTRGVSSRREIRQKLQNR
jgi:DNA topoisomerase VI subunit A